MVMSVVVVLLSLIALVSPLWLYFMHKTESIDPLDKENTMPYDDRLEQVTVLVMEEKDIDLLEELMLIVSSRRLILHDLLQEDKARIVTGYGY